MRKLLLGSIILLSLSACNTDKNSSTSVPQKTVEQEKPKAESTDITSMEKEKKFRQIMAADHLPNGLNETERAFAIAVRAGEEAKVEELLKQGANPNQEVTSDYLIYRSALCNVAYEVGMGHPNQKEYENIVKLLLKSGAKANENCDCGTTPLMIASSSGRSLVTVKALIEAGADVNATDEEGRTALFKANNPEIVKALLAAGADINAVDGDGHNAFFDEYSKDGEVLKILLDAGIKVSQKDKDEALRKSCLNAGVKGVEVLLAYGANASSKDENGNTVLMKAALAPLAHYGVDSAETIIKMLIAAGADVNAVDHKGNTALIKVMAEWSDSDGANYDRVDLIDVLVAAGADVNAVNKEGKNALMSIYLEDYTDYDSIVKKLLSVGVDINATDNQGRTVLMDFISKVSKAVPDEYEHPSEYPSMEKIKSFLNTLISVGVDINAKDKDGNTALKLAQKAGNTEIVKLLKAAGAKE